MREKFSISISILRIKFTWDWRNDFNWLDHIFERGIKSGVNILIFLGLITDEWYSEIILWFGFRKNMNCRRKAEHKFDFHYSLSFIKN